MVRLAVMASAIRPPDSLDDGQVRLRGLTEGDFDPWLQAFVDDPTLGVVLGTEQDPSLEELRGHLERWPVRAAEGRGVDFVIADAESDDLLGAVNMFALDWHSRRGEVGVWLRREARGRGIGSAALGLLLDWAFGSLQLARVEMTTIPENEQLPRLADRLGFVHEGVLRSRNLERGRRVDIVFFGLLRDEWTSSRAGGR